MNRKDIAPGIFTIPSLLSPETCASLIEQTEFVGYTSAPVTTARGPVHMPDVRNNSRLMIDDPARAQVLWEQIRQVMPIRGRWRPIGLNERLRFYRYEPGQRFALHRDGHFARNHNERSFLTFMIYLNGDCEGGQTRFTNAIVSPEAGTALCFEHPLLHEGAEVTRGLKYVLRTDVMYRRKPTTFISLPQG